MVIYIVEYTNKAQQRARENSCIQVYLTSIHINDLICDFKCGSLYLCVIR